MRGREDLRGTWMRRRELSAFSWGRIRFAVLKIRVIRLLDTSTVIYGNQEVILLKRRLLIRTDVVRGEPLSLSSWLLDLGMLGETTELPSAWVSLGLLSYLVGFQDRVLINIKHDTEETADPCLAFESSVTPHSVTIWRSCIAPCGCGYGSDAWIAYCVIRKWLKDLSFEFLSVWET